MNATPSHTAPLTVVGPRFVDERFGLEAFVHSPHLSRAPWHEHLEAVTACYRERGVERVLGRPALDRVGCSLFWNVTRNDELVGGVRVHGPHARAVDYAVVAEMETSASFERLEALIRDSVDDGLIEFKGAWSNVEGRDRRCVSNLIARTAIYSARWLGTRYALCTCDAKLARAWRVSGARVLEDLAPVAFPDERFSTVAAWWDFEDHARVDPQTRERVDVEWKQLHAGVRR